jgi:hypothetical protein
VHFPTHGSGSARWGSAAVWFLSWSMPPHIMMHCVRHYHLRFMPQLQGLMLMPLLAAALLAPGAARATFLQASRPMSESVAVGSCMVPAACSLHTQEITRCLIQTLAM